MQCLFEGASICCRDKEALSTDERVPISAEKKSETICLRIYTTGNCYDL